MPFVSAGQLAALRSVAYRGLDTPFEVYRRQRTESPYGTQDSWVKVAEGLCWLRMMNQPKTTTHADDSEGALTVYRMHTDVAITVQFGDRIRIGGADYETQDTNDDDTIQVFRTLILRRIQ